VPKKKYDDEELRKKALEFRKKGMSYREIAKELGCSVYKVHQVLSPLEGTSSRLKQAVELAKRVDEASQRLEELSKGIDELSNKLEELRSELREMRAKVESISKDMELVSSQGEWKSKHCKYCREDGYCAWWRWYKEVKGWDMKEEIDGWSKIYRLNVRKHSIYCATCSCFAWK